jgi:hypothetical protein
MYYFYFTTFISSLVKTKSVVRVNRTDVCIALKKDVFIDGKLTNMLHFVQLL